MSATTTPDFERECFLISPIGDEKSDVRRRADGVRDYIVGPAAAELSLVSVRADQISQPGQITLQVIEHVLGAKAAVADLSGANPNVFYELAIRHTARLPVVLIAHEDDRQKLPFDIAQMRTIFYNHQDLKSAADCRAQITVQLREALEKGAVDSPVAASVNLAHLERGNPSEQVLAQLVGSVETLADRTARSERSLEVIAEFVANSAVPVTPSAVSDLESAVGRLLEISQQREEDAELSDVCRDLLRPARYLIDRFGGPALGAEDEMRLTSAAELRRRRRLAGMRTRSRGAQASSGADDEAENEGK